MAKNGIDKFNQPGVTSKQPAVARGKPMSYGPKDPAKAPLKPKILPTYKAGQNSGGTRIMPSFSSNNPPPMPHEDRIRSELRKGGDHTRTMASQHRRKGN
jgi:hypothetical protein